MYNKLKEVAFAGDYDDRDRRDTSKMGILDRAREVILTLQDEEQQLVHAKEQVQLENEHYCRKLASIAFQ